MEKKQVSRFRIASFYPDFAFVSNLPTFGVTFIALLRYISGIILDKLMRKMKQFTYITWLVSAFLLLISVAVFGQSATKEKGGPSVDENKIMLPAVNVNGEALPTVVHTEVPVFAARTFKSDKDRLAYFKLKRDVRKAYPYAVLASVKLREYDAILANIPENKQAPYLKKTEKELKEQFESDLKNLTQGQGKILIRLINRETGMTTFKVIKEYRGGFSAFIWQSFSILWGNNLKWKYDPSHGEDLLIEGIIQQIQDGEV